MRIHQVARKYHLENKQILTYLESIGMEGKSHSSSIDDGTLELLLQHFGKIEAPKPKEEDHSNRFAKVRRPKGWKPSPHDEEPSFMTDSAPGSDQDSGIQLQSVRETKPESPSSPESKEGIIPTPETPKIQFRVIERPLPEAPSEPPVEPARPQREAPASPRADSSLESTASQSQSAKSHIEKKMEPPVKPAVEPQAKDEHIPATSAGTAPSFPVQEPARPKDMPRPATPSPAEPRAEDASSKKESRGKKKRPPKPLKKQKLKTVVLEPKVESKDIIIEAPDVDVEEVETRAPLSKDDKEAAAKHDQDEAIRREIQKLKLKQKRATDKPKTKDATPAKRTEVRKPHPQVKGKGKKAWKREKRERLEQQIAAEEQRIKRDKTVLKIHEATTVADIADGLGIAPNELIQKLIMMGVMASINQRLDKETVQIIADDYGFAVEEVDLFDSEIFSQVWEDDMDESRMVFRPPVVTIMGHVDHGKTKLLDAVRSSDIVSQEAGGITQHIGAYYVATPGGDIVFLDTPGHAAFTAMRARGAMVTDIVILVVAATDGVMPQTVEAIHHAKAAGVPIIVAVNKIDLEAANMDRTKQQLAEHGLIPEEWGGNTVLVPISAKQKIGIEDLLEAVLLQAELLELKADPDCRARGTIIEGRLEQGRGPVATVLLQQGRLHVGDPFVTGVFSGRVRAMLNNRGEHIDEAGPSTPVEILGNEDVPSAGDPFIVVQDDAQAKQISSRLQQIQREREMRRTRHVTLEDLHAQIQQGQIKELQIIVKGDVQGSVGAVCESLLKIESDKVRIDIIHSGVGAITESDVMLASASNALIIGFNVRPYAHVSDLAKREHVDIRTYRVIYDAINDIRQAMTGMLEKTKVEKQIGMAQVREVFRLSRGISIAGLMVQHGQMVRNKPIRLLRDSVVVHEGKLSSLKRFKDDVKEVAAGFECGIGIENFNDIRPGDLVECYEVTEVAQTL
ncbi:MAG: translation initiation factor IF-2 [bacterium]|jgi:translation initiation factor IF-2|nr:translation initiation factor IF-2 [bacterium]